MSRLNANDAAARFASSPLLPRDEGGPVFAEPWQAQAFAMAVQLSAAGYFNIMIVLGLVLLLLGLVLGIGILWTAGIVVWIVGAVLMLLGRTGRPVGGRAHYW